MKFLQLEGYFGFASNSQEKICTEASEDNRFFVHSKYVHFGIFPYLIPIELHQTCSRPPKNNHLSHGDMDFSNFLKKIVCWIYMA